MTVLPQHNNSDKNTVLLRVETHSVCFIPMRAHVYIFPCILSGFNCVLQTISSHK